MKYSFFKSFFIQKSVINALFLRELKARFTSSKGGLFWTFFQPFFTIIIFVIAHSVLVNKYESYEYAIFITVNLIPFLLFRNILLKATGSFRANKGLFVYKQVKPFDTLIARIFVEFFISLIIAFIIILIIYILGIKVQIKNLSMAIVGVLWLMLFGMGLGLLLAIANKFNNFTYKVVSFLGLPLLLLSAVFYSVESIYLKAPMLVKPLLYNPVVHFMEMIHGNFFYDLNTRYVDYSYMVLWTIIPFGIAIWLYIHLEEKIVSL